MNQVGAVLHDAQAQAALTREWNDIVGDERSVQEYVRDARSLMLQRHFVAERKSLLRVLSSLAHASVESRDWSAEALGRMLDELLLAFPVYRSYVGENGRSQADACLFNAVVEQLRQRLEFSEYDCRLLEWLNDCLGAAPLSMDDPVPGVSLHALQREAVRRFQQLTPPLAAKSLEDTVFYRYGRDRKSVV